MSTADPLDVEPRRPEPAPPVLLSAVLKVALVVVGLAGVLGWLGLALAHLGDRYQVGHVQGAWMALAQYANAGTLYPPLFDGERFGGTRWMPLPVLVNAGAARITGEYLMSGKAVAVVLFAGLLVLLFFVLRRLGCHPALAVGLTGLVPATPTGLLVGSTVGGDVLPVVLQVGALLVMAVAVRRQGMGLSALAGVLAGLAVSSKLSGMWAALAVVSWIGLRRDWRRLSWFGVPFLVTLAIVLGSVQWASDGRLLSTFLAFTFSGTGGPVGWIRAPNQLIQFGIGATAAVWIIAPFAVVSLLAARRSAELTLYHHALAWCLLLTLGVFTDMGAGLNHMLDLAVLAVISVGALAARLDIDELGSATLITGLVIAVLWAGATGVRGFVPDLRETLAGMRAGQVPSQYTPTPLAALIRPGETLLSEDPTVAVLLGRTPVVLDAFMLRRIDELHAETVDVLIARIERREFDHVALVTPLDEEDFWWQHYHFGLRVVTALRDAYDPVGEVDGFYLYQPGDQASPSG